jgi:hypothetical protein
MAFRASTKKLCLAVVLFATLCVWTIPVVARSQLTYTSTLLIVPPSSLVPFTRTLPVSCRAHKDVNQCMSSCLEIEGERARVFHRAVRADADARCRKHCAGEMCKH